MAGNLSGQALVGQDDLDLAGRSRDVPHREEHRTATDHDEQQGQKEQAKQGGILQLAGLRRRSPTATRAQVAS